MSALQPISKFVQRT
jgi:hypothetical protein